MFKNKIKVVGLADHGSIDSSASLRTYLSENDILTLPGFEISSAEKIHMVCLFSPEFDNSRLNRILGQLGLPTDIKNGTESSSLSCLEIAKKFMIMMVSGMQLILQAIMAYLKLGK